MFVRSILVICCGLLAFGSKASASVNDLAVSSQPSAVGAELANDLLKADG